MKHNSTTQFLNVKIINMSSVLYSGHESTMVVMPGVDGEIGVMYGRTPLIVELKAGNISISQDEKVISTIEINGGIAMVNYDSVDIILSNKKI